ncbi:MAG TPA: RDD family protein [Glaciibacter sp.]|nr:RDD family protein [Glaciibacter sp.]
MTNELAPGIQASAQQPAFCAACGTAAQGQFCAGCGAAMGTSAPAQAGTVQPQVSPTAPAPSSPVIGHVEPHSVQPGFVSVAAVARQTSEYIEVNGLGVVKLATIGQRILARVLDFLVVVIGYWLIIAIFAVIGGIISATTSSSSSYVYDDGSAAIGGALTFVGSVILGLFFSAVLAYAYEIAMVTLWGRTVGKMIVGARIVRTANGKKPNLANAFLRWLTPGLGALIPFVGGLGALLVLLSPTFDSSGRRQGWHDKMASTLVIAAPRSITKETGAALFESARATGETIRDNIKSK